MGIRWQGYKHPDLYEMINNGPGAAASEPQTAYWQGLAEELGKVDEDLNTSLTQLGATWEGEAATSANSGLTPLASWATDATTGSNVMKVSSENQAEYVSDARAKMPEPVEVTAQKPSGWDQFLAGAALAAGNAGPARDVAQQAEDYEAQEAAQSEAEQRAIQTMETYESSSVWNRDTLGEFVPPPDVVVSTPEPQGGTGGTVLLNSAEVKNVGNNGIGSNYNGGSPQGSNPQVSPTPYPNGNDGGYVAPPPGGGGGNVVTPPPAGTSPQDVYTPPVQGGNPPYLPTNPGPGPGQGPNLGPNPYLPPGQFPGRDNNAGDIARRAMPPVGPGRPGMGDPFGRGMPGGPGGGLPGGIDGERSPSQLGRGGALGSGPPESVVRSGPGAAGAAGARGNGVNGPMGAGGRRADGEDDDEHFAPDYLMETDDVFGDDRRVAPNVIGE